MQVGLATCTSTILQKAITQRGETWEDDIK